MAFILNVRQRGEDDCAVAAIATACGLSWEEVAAEFPDPERTTTTPAIADFLDRRGFRWQCVARRGGDIFFAYSGKGWARSQLEEWPPKLWSPLHIATVDAPSAEAFCKAYGRDASAGSYRVACHHVVTVLQSGDVLDPQYDELKRWEDYKTVFDLWGLWKAAPAAGAARVQTITRADPGVLA